MANALELHLVSKIYDVGGVELIALDHVDLTLAADEVVTLLGPSGSGKTTLLSIAGGLLSPTSGRVVVGGEDVTRLSARRLTKFRRERVGFIFQAVNLVPFLTARENLLVVAELARRKKGEAKARAERLLEELGLGRRMDNLPAQLSGGERQRVAIGRALMNSPELVLVDEPTSALDSDLGQQVMELIVSEVKARGAAAVVVTHDARITRFGDRILNMADGRIAGIAPRPEWTTQRPAPIDSPETPAPPLVLPAAQPLAQPLPLTPRHPTGPRPPSSPPARRRPAAPAASLPLATRPDTGRHDVVPPRPSTGPGSGRHDVVPPRPGTGPGSGRHDVVPPRPGTGPGSGRHDVVPSRPDTGPYRGRPGLPPMPDPRRLPLDARHPSHEEPLGRPAAPPLESRRPLGPADEDPIGGAVGAPLDEPGMPIPGLMDLVEEPLSRSAMPTEDAGFWKEADDSGKFRRRNRRRRPEVEIGGFGVEPPVGDIVAAEVAVPLDEDSPLSPPKGTPAVGNGLPVLVPGLPPAGPHPVEPLPPVDPRRQPLTADLEPPAPPRRPPRSSDPGFPEVPAALPPRTTDPGRRPSGPRPPRRTIDPGVPPAGQPGPRGPRTTDPGLSGRRYRPPTPRTGSGFEGPPFRPPTPPGGMPAVSPEQVAWRDLVEKGRVRPAGELDAGTFREPAAAPPAGERRPVPGWVDANGLPVLVPGMPPARPAPEPEEEVHDLWDDPQPTRPVRGSLAAPTGLPRDRDAADPPPSIWPRPEPPPRPAPLPPMHEDDGGIWPTAWWGSEDEES